MADSPHAQPMGRVAGNRQRRAAATATALDDSRLLRWSTPCHARWLARMLSRTQPSALSAGGGGRRSAGPRWPFLCSPAAANRAASDVCAHPGSSLLGLTWRRQGTTMLRPVQRLSTCAAGQAPRSLRWSSTTVRPGRPHSRRSVHLGRFAHHGVAFRAPWRNRSIGSMRADQLAKSWPAPLSSR